MVQEEKEKSFVQKVWIVTGIVCLAVVLLLLLKTVFSVLLLVLAGSLIAIFFRSFGGLIQQKTGLSSTTSLLISTIGTLVLLIGLIWLIGAKVQAQAEELSDTLPTTIEKTKAQLQSTSLGQKILDRMSSAGSVKKVQGVAEQLFSSTFGALGDLYVVLFLGLFFTASPKPYVEGFLQLIPGPGRRKARSIVNTIGEDLKKWLKGKLFAMLVVFALTAVGLAIVGIPMWLTLAIIAGLLNFIPNFGPLIAMIPAVLIGFLQGPTTALIVAGLYIVIQVLESNLITPSVQKKLINIPPALIIIAQLLMGVLTGGWGLLLATPLIVIVLVVVRMVYLNKNTTAQ